MDTMFVSLFYDSGLLALAFWILFFMINDIPALAYKTPGFLSLVLWLLFIKLLIFQATLLSYYGFSERCFFTRRAIISSIFLFSS